MLKYICISLLWIMCACSETISPPKNLIKEDKMAELIADFAINEQMSIINPNGDSEASTLYLFQKYKVSAKDFSGKNLRKIPRNIIGKIPRIKR